MNKNTVKNFLKSHRNLELSAAKLEYSIFLYDGMEELVSETIGDRFYTEEDKETERQISEANTGEDYIRLMRKGMSGLNHCNLRQKLLLNEDILSPKIKNKALSNLQSIFIENTLYFFLHCNENACDWIVENYTNFRSEYMKSMLCLVLGFRGEKELIPFLISEAERFEKYYPNETYDQGPLLAVQELSCRFLND